MKPFEEVQHIPKLFHDLKIFDGHDGQLKLIERIRDIAIARLEPITPPGADLRNLEYASFFNHEVQENPEYSPYKNAANVLRACTHAIETGNVKQHHIDWIVTNYSGLDKRWIAKVKQLRAPKQKKNKALLHHCKELMQAKSSCSAAHLFKRIPEKKKGVTIDGFTIYREFDEDGEEKIYCITATGRIERTVGLRPFSDYYKVAKKV